MGKKVQVATMGVRKMAIISTKVGLIGAAGMALVGGAWAFSGGSEEGDADNAETAFEAEAPADDGLSEVRPALNPALKGSGLRMDVSITAGRNRAVANLILSNNAFKGFTNNTESSAPATNTAFDTATDASGGPASDEPTNANENHEVIYDIIDNKRVLVDHGRKTYREETMAEKPKVPFGLDQRKISKSAKPEQEAALRKLMGQMTQARLDPKREIKLGEGTGESTGVRVSDLTIDCGWMILMRAGGPIGKVCLALDSDVPLASELRATLLKMPLPAADENDYLSYLRQIAVLRRERFPLIVRFEDEYNEDNFQEWRVEGTSRVDLDPSGFEPPKGYIRRDPR